MGGIVGIRIQVIAAETNKWSPAEFGREIAAAVLDRAFEHAEYEPRPKRAVVDWRGREARGLGSVVLGELKGRGKDKRMSIQADNLTRLQQDYHSRGGVQIVNSDSVAYPFVTDDHVFSWSDVLDSVSPVNRALIADYFEDHRNLVAMIFVGSETIGPAYQHDFRTR